MYLLVTPNGSKLWRLKYMVDGKEKGVSLGPYPEVSSADAREKRDKIRKLLKQGTDLSAAKKIVYEEGNEQLITFREAAERWYRANAIESAPP